MKNSGIMRVKLLLDFVSGSVAGSRPKVAQWVREIEMDYPPTKGLIISFDFTRPDGRTDSHEYRIDFVVYDPETKSYTAHTIEKVSINEWHAKIGERPAILPGWQWVD